MRKLHSKLKELVAQANSHTYLEDVVQLLKTHWPQNRTVNFVCHGHSVPAGYFATPFVDTFNAYPHLWHRGLKERFPFAPMNVIVTAIGGENSKAGAARFESEVLCHRPDVVTIDYGLNDRGLGLEAARIAWCEMIEKAKAANVKVLLLTPTSDRTQIDRASDDAKPLQDHAQQIRELANEYEVGLVDSLAAFERYTREQGELSDLMSWSNHPNRKGHELVARELLCWIPAVNL